MDHSPTLVVMAGGIGSRYGGIKQIEPFGPNGEILLDYAAYDAVCAGFRRIVFVIREEFREAFQQRIEPTIATKCRVDYALQQLDAMPPGEKPPRERRKPWGTAHAVLACREVLDGPFAVINADDFYGRAAFERLHEHLQSLTSASSMHDAALIGYALSKTLTDHGDVSRGVCRVASDGRLEEIDERKRIRRFGEAIRYAVSETEWLDLDPEATVSMNMWAFPLAMIERLERCWADFVETRRADLSTAEFLLPEVVGEWIREGSATVHVLPTTASWFGVTYPEDRPRVVDAIRALTRAGEYPTPLWATPAASR